MAGKADILLKKVRVYCETHPRHLSTTDISIDGNGIILSTQPNQVIKAKRTIEQKGLCVSPGWFDFGVQSGEPGHEDRENFKSLAEAAANGGYTCLAIFPNTQPAIDNRSMVEYVEKSTKDLPVDIKTIGAVSKRCEGKELAEILDMHQGGAIAYSDGMCPIGDDALMLKALEYSKKIKATILNMPSSIELSNKSYVNEGKVSAGLGIKGDAELSEIVMLSRDIDLLQYADSNLLCHMISTRESLRRIKLAKSSTKSSIRSSVSYLNLCETDQRLTSFDTNYKVSPPLRSERDRKALIKGIQSGTIDAIVSNHFPIQVDLKDREFAFASHGAIGLETCFAKLNTSCQEEINLETLVAILSMGNKKALGVPASTIDENHMADLTLFEPNRKWNYSVDKIASMSSNSPYINHEFRGRIFGTIFNGELRLNK